MPDRPQNQNPRPDISRLREIVAHLRSPDGCPWDREQTHSTLKSQLIEECYEVLEAIDSGDARHLREELGDILLHVLMHAEIARESGGFAFEDVVADLAEKLVRRHPHVFGGASAGNPDEVIKLWEMVKQDEKAAERTSAIDGIPAALPSIMRAEKAGKKAARVGFDWPDSAGVVAKIQEELDELRGAIQSGDRERVAEEIGDLLFSVVNLARKEKLEGELLLHEATDKFIRRFRTIERNITASGTTMKETAPELLDLAWQRAKSTGKKSV